MLEFRSKVYCGYCQRWGHRSLTTYTWVHSVCKPSSKHEFPLLCKEKGEVFQEYVAVRLIIFGILIAVYFLFSNNLQITATEFG